MAKPKYYAVKQGRCPGIYNTWDECKKQTDGYSGAVFKSFASFEDAEEYLYGERTDFFEDKNGQFSIFETDKKAKENPKSPVIKEQPEVKNEDKIYIYVDGSFNNETKKYSYGMVVVKNGHSLEEKNGTGENQDMAQMRNVAGELIGAIAAMRYCIDHNIKDVVLCYDYEGIACWPLREWDTTKIGTRAYVDFYDRICPLVNITFKHIKGHSGNKYNEIADKLARQALGL